MQTYALAVTLESGLDGEAADGLREEFEDQLRGLVMDGESASVEMVSPSEFRLRLDTPFDLIPEDVRVIHDMVWETVFGTIPQGQWARVEECEAQPEPRPTFLH